MGCHETTQERLEKIRNHWKCMAGNGRNLTATTKNSTIKRLEIQALADTLSEITEKYNSSIRRVLEVGCGNGHNLVPLSHLFPDTNFHGIDYIAEMVENAVELARAEQRRIDFYVGDILELDGHRELLKQYDVVFTDRCLINLPESAIQAKGFVQLADKVADNGFLIVIENFVESYGNQNIGRRMMGLEERFPDSYNTFIHEDDLTAWASRLGLELLDVNNFGSLHDLMLYVLLPALSEGRLDYSHPLMEIVAQFSIESSKTFKNQFGAFGQNKLFLFQKTKTSS